MVDHRLLAAAAALLLALPATAAAADPLPVGQADGVRVTSSRSGLAFHFSRGAAGLYREIAGRAVDLSCTWLEPSDHLGVSLAGSSTGVSTRAPRRRAPLHAGTIDFSRTDGRRADYCSVAPAGSDGTAEALVSVPLTQTGAITLDQQRTAGVLYGVLTFAGTIADRSTPAAYPAPTRLAASRIARLVAREGYRLIALAAPTDTPPAAKTFGYWSDGRRSAAVVALSADGRRLHIDVGPDGEISTNVLGLVLGML